MSKDYLQAVTGATIIGLTVFNIVPGDEVIGVPLGVALILNGMGWLDG